MGRQSSRLRSMMMGRPLPARRMSTTVAGTSTAHGMFAGGELTEHSRRLLSPATTDAAVTASLGRKGKPLALEEPYIIQPTAAVFQKLYALLVRSLSRLNSGVDTSRASTASSVLSLLQIMRANFCRLVDAHVDPAEVGLSLDYDRHGVVSGSESNGRDGEERLLPDILHCLQGIMLQQDGDPVLLRATVDTFTSGLPLLMPRVENRLHLLLGLVGHLQSSGSQVCDVPERRGAGKGLPGPAFMGQDASTRLAQIPRERVTLLRDLLMHFARTESVLQLLTLFEEDKTERSSVSDLLELMLTSTADRACRLMGSESNDDGQLDMEKNHPAQSRAAEDNVSPRPFGASGNRRMSHWDQLVAGGAGGTTLNFTLLDTCQQHLLYMVLERDRASDNPHELLLCQYGQCLVQVGCGCRCVERGFASFGRNSSCPILLFSRLSTVPKISFSHRNSPILLLRSHVFAECLQELIPNNAPIWMYVRRINFAQVCCRVLSAECSAPGNKADDGENPWWQLVGVLLPPFLHGLCMCVDRPRVAEGMLPPLVSGGFCVGFLLSYVDILLYIAAKCGVLWCNSWFLPTAVLFWFWPLARCACRRFSLVASTEYLARRQLRQTRRKLCGRHSLRTPRKDLP